MVGRKKGTQKTGGRVAGTPNRTTKEARELFVSIMNGEIDYIKEALEMVRKDSYTKYLDILSKLFQYSMPKQIDVTSGDEKINKVEITFIDKIAEDTGK